MPVVNVGLQRTRDLVVGEASSVVDSIGFGTNDSAEDPSDDRLGVGGTSYWKTSPDTTLSTGEDSPDDPWWQIEATWDTSEANATLYEIGTSAGSLTGTDPSGNDGTMLYTRRRIGGSSGIGKTSDIELVGRVKVTY